MIRKRSRAVLGGIFFLACLWSLLPAQTSPNAQTCQGSTVDAQGEEIAEKSRAFLAQLQTAVSGDDKNKVASMISYPLLVIRGARKSRIRTKPQFLEHYDNIFDPHVHHAIAQQSAKCLFGNYQGTMIGDGEIWYREQANGKMKIVTVNPTAGMESTSH
ncbi:MAG TPA: hypothetical protein VKB58_16260 [Terriglobales bacterium]|jgi:hypothetical protein|nr:hypothetical protein [Terriglobales bacterium]